MPHHSLIIYNKAISQFISTDFEIEKLADDCLFTEGPVWNEDGYYLFSDIPANCIYKIVPGNNKELFLQNSGTENTGDPDLKPDQIGSNALAYLLDGTLVICQHGGHRLAKYNRDQINSFIEGYHGKPFNSPNDLIIHSSGKIFFSDPPYGLRDGKLNSLKFQPLAGVYCWHYGNIQMICDKYQYPNGVCLSLDEKILYICSNKPSEKFISAYDTHTYQFLKIVAEENSDGIECDAHGNIFLCNKDGIIVLNSEGQRLALLKLQSIPANLCWGGKNKKDLFVTAREKVYLIRDFKK